MRGQDRAAVPGPVMAAIVAAIAAVLDRPAGIQVVSVRPLAAPSGAWPPLWALAGRQAQMAARGGPGRRKGKQP